MRTPFLISAVSALWLLAPALQAQDSFYIEDWWNNHVVAADTASSSKIVFTMPAPHRFPVGSTFKGRILGGTGSWSAVNTQGYFNNFGGANSRLLEYVNASDTTILVSTPTRIPVGSTVKWQNEIMLVTGVNGRELTVTRGYNGTTAAEHPALINCLVNVHTPTPPDTRVITVESDTQLSIVLDGRSFGPLTGDVRVYDLNGNGDPSAREALALAGADADIVDGEMVTSMSTCDGTVMAYCGFYYPSATGAAGFFANYSTVVVSSGVATLTLLSAVTQSPYPAAGEYFVIESATNPIVSGIWRISTINAERTIITFNANSGRRVIPDGTYTGSGTSTDRFFRANRQGSAYTYFSMRSGGFSYPTSYLKAKVKSGYNINYNRITVPMTVNASVPRVNTNLGTYIRGPMEYNGSQQGNHLYNEINGPVYAGRKMVYTITPRPFHHNAISGDTWWNAFTEPLFGGQKYFDSLTEMYFDMSVTPTSVYTPYAITQWKLGQIQGWQVDDEPDDYIAARKGVWSPQRYDSGNKLKKDPGYSVSWYGNPITATTYDVAYSTAGSLKARGWSSGTVGATGMSLASGPPRYTWKSDAMPEQDDFWVAIRPKAVVAWTSGADVSPISIVLKYDLNLRAGDTITVDGVGGNSAANQTNVPITSYQPRTYNYVTQPTQRCMLMSIGSSGGGTSANLYQCPTPYSFSAGDNVQYECMSPAGDKWEGPVASMNGTALVLPKPYVACGTGRIQKATPGNIIGITASSGVCTANWRVPHGFVVGQPFIVADSDALGTLPGSFYSVSSVPDPASFTFNCPGASGVTYPVTLGYGAIATLPTYTIDGVGSGNYSKGGTMVSTTDTRGFAEVYIPRQPEGPLPVAPGNMAYVPLSPTEVTLSWDDNSTIEDGYSLEADDGSGYQEIIRLPRNSTVWTVSSLAVKSGYRFRVRAFNDAGYSEYSEEVSVTTGDVISGRIGGLALGQSAIFYYTADSEAACTWGLQSSGQPAISGSDAGGDRRRTLQVSSLLADRLYVWRIQCSGAAGGTFRTAQAKPPSARTVAISAANPAPGADNLVVEHGVGPDQLVESTNAACTGPRCTAHLTAPSDSIVWVRRRWCRNGQLDPQCLTPSNELARSRPEPVTLQ